MIILANTTDKLEAILAGAVTTNQFPCYISWRDRTSTTFIAGRTLINTNSANAVDISGSPGESTQRIIDKICVFNDDTANGTVTIRYNANNTTYVLIKTTLAPGESLMYVEGEGFFVLATTGARKLSINQGANTPSGSQITTVVLGSDQTNNNAVANTIQDVTGLSFSVSANKRYWFKFVIFYTSANTSTGSRWGVNCTAGTAAGLSMKSEYSLTSTTTTRNANIQAFDSPAASNATSAATTNNICIMEGIFTPTADGTFIARFASEVSNSAIVAKAGSCVYYQQLN
jgi:hypothetical protein